MMTEAVAFVTFCVSTLRVHVLPFPFTLLMALNDDEM